MNKFFTIIGCILLLVCSARARLGESPSEIIKRYGPMKGTPKILGKNEWNGNFRHAGYDITVTFWNGKAAEEEFFDDANSIAEDDAQTIFRAVSGDGKITPRRPSDPKLHTIYFDNLSNGALGLLCNDGINDGSLTVMSKDYMDFSGKNSREATKKKMAGF